MATQLTFEEHDSFHAEVLRGTIGATAGGLLLGVGLSLAASPAGLWPQAAVWVLPGLGLGIGFIGRDLATKLRRALIASVACVAPALVLHYLAFPPYDYLAFSVILAGLGLGVISTLWQGGGLKRIAGTLLGIPALLLGGFAAYRFGAYGLSNALAPAPVIAALAGGVGGFVTMAVAGLRRLSVLSDPVSRAYKQAEEILRGDLLRQATQAKRVYDQIQEDLAKHEVEKVLEHEICDRSKELCLSLFENATRWQKIKGDTVNQDEAEIRTRIAGLMTSASEASDPVAKEQYERAARSLTEQLDYLSSIEQGHERTVARIVAQLALLEKVRFSLVNFHATDTERLADELRAVGSELETLTSDVDVIGEVIREVGVRPPVMEKEAQ